jgi:hypothetical protein
MPLEREGLFVDARTGDSEHSTQSSWVRNVVGGGHRKVSLE